MSDVVQPNLENPLKALSHTQGRVETVWTKTRFNLDTEKLRVEIQARRVWDQVKHRVDVVPATEAFWGELERFSAQRSAQEVGDTHPETTPARHITPTENVAT